MTTDSTSLSPRTLSRRTEIIFLVIYCICFGVVTPVHFFDVLHNGWVPRATGPVAGTSLPLVWGFFNKSLTVFNPMVLVLMFAKRQAGIALMVGITTTVFAMNLQLMVQWWAEAEFFFFQWMPLSLPLGIFQLVTAPKMWRTAAAREAARSASPAIAG